MNQLIPDSFKINGDVVIRFDMESLVQFALVMVIVIIIGLLSQKFIKQI